MTIKEYLNVMDRSRLFTVCCSCGEYQGIKDGKGVSGCSHSYCPTCLSVLMDKIHKEHGHV